MVVSKTQHLQPARGIFFQNNRCKVARCALITSVALTVLVRGIALFINITGAVLATIANATAGTLVFLVLIHVIMSSFDRKRRGYNCC